MKLLTLNFLTCAVKSCKPLPAAFPLHVRDAELESVSTDFNPLFLRNILPRLDWSALAVVAGECGLTIPANPLEAPVGTISAQQGEGEEMMDVDGQVQQQEDEEQGRKRTEETAVAEGEVSEEVLRKLHAVLIETQIASGKLVCGNCGHEYAVREGIPNFLLPAHLV